MSTTRRGITNHEICESIERVHKKMIRMGWTEAESLRGAIALTAALSGEFTREQAWEFADEITGQSKGEQP